MNAQEDEEREQQERLERSKEMRREEEKEREEKENEERAILEQLSKGNVKNAEKLVAKSRAAAAKRLLARTAAANSAVVAPKRREGVATIPDPPHKPLDDNWYAYEDKFVLRRDYDDAVSEDVRGPLEKVMRAGGYRIDEAWERAIRLAVAGLETVPLVG